MATFQNRQDAGRVLASRLEVSARGTQPYVLGLPCGGVPVAYEVAKALHAPLDVLVVRKLGVPGREELAVGAIAGGVQLVNRDTALYFGVSPEALSELIQQEERELQRRERLYRGSEATLDIANRHVVLIDDGFATGLTMRAGIELIRKYEPSRLTVAAPVGAPAVCKELAQLADDVFCAVKPANFQAVGVWYEDFAQTTDDEVRRLLAQNKRDLAHWNNGEPVSERALRRRA